MNANEERRALVRPLMAVGRMGKDLEIASLVAYLTGPKAGLITGSAITIDGGYWREVAESHRLLPGTSMGKSSTAGRHL
jgi:NAD(P)-dependent dehydrogenase (short-subunit alcohol dehydrogenase family)